MTVIVGLEFDGKVYMGSDSGAFDSNGNRMPSSIDKILKRENILLGAAGDLRICQILRKMPLENYNGNDTYAFLYDKFIPSLEQTCREENYQEFKSESGEPPSVLIGLNGELWEIGYDFYLFRSSNKFNAVGSGKTLALAALLCVETLSKESPEAKILQVLDFVNQLHIYTLPPYKVLMT